MNNLELPEETGKDKLYNLVKGAIGAIPIAGSIAAETFGLIIAAPITKRRQEWMQIVIDKLRELEQRDSNFNIESLRDNPEFISFILESSSIAFKTHQQEKLNVLRNAIGSFFMTDTIDYDKKHSFLRIIDEITPTHLQILFFIEENEELIISKIKGFQSLLDEYQKLDEPIDKFHFRKCVVDLENQSLIRISRDFADFVSGGGFAVDEGAPSIKLLDFGQDFIRFIKSEG